MRVVARDWATYWQLGLPKIDVDWDREMVLVAALGPTYRLDATVNVRDIDWNGSVLVPHVEVVTGSASEETAGARPLRMQSPYEIVVVPTSDENVVGFTPEPPARARKRDQSGFSIPGLR